MDVNFPLELRQKYGLVHIPSRSRVERWCEVTRAGIRSGLPPEAAGLHAARDVFPYEARRIPDPDAASVESLLIREGRDHPL